MIALIQRVSEAQVRVGGELVGAIGRGVLALIGVQRGDSAESGARLLERVKGDTEKLAKVEMDARFEGRQMIMILAPR